jgi:hypothetical protein
VKGTKKESLAQRAVKQRFVSNLWRFSKLTRSKTLKHFWLGSPKDMICVIVYFFFHFATVFFSFLFFERYEDPCITSLPS